MRLVLTFACVVALFCGIQQRRALCVVLARLLHVAPRPRWGLDGLLAPRSIRWRPRLRPLAGVLLYVLQACEYYLVVAYILMVAYIVMGHFMVAFVSVMA